MKRWLFGVFQAEDGGIELTEIFSLVVVLAFMAGLYYFFLRGATRDGSSAKILGLLAKKQSRIPEFFSGLLVAFCLLELGVVHDELSALSLGVAIALISGVCAFGSRAVRLIVHATYGIFGIAGTALAIAKFVNVLQGEGFAESDWFEVWGRVIALVLVLVFVAWGALIAFTTGRASLKSALGLFGAIHILLFLAAPISTQILTAPGALLLSLLGAVVLGLTAGINSIWVEVLASIVISLETLMIFGMGFDSSGSLLTPAELSGRISIFVGFLIPFGLMWLIGNRWRQKVSR